MPLIYNGVTIPENVAGSLIYNGVSITQVVYNGTIVWNQNLGPTIGFSGDMLAMFWGYPTGIDVDQSNPFNFRATETASVAVYGAWMGYNPSSNAFVGTSSASGGNYSMTVTGSGLVLTFGGSGSISYNPSNKTFSGGPANSFGGTYRTQFETSGGGLRAVMYGNGGIIGAPSAYQFLT